MPLHLALILFFSVLAKRWAGKSISSLTYLVLSGMLNLNSINQSIRLRKKPMQHVICQKWLSEWFYAIQNFVCWLILMSGV